MTIRQRITVTVPAFSFEADVECEYNGIEIRGFTNNVEEKLTQVLYPELSKKYKEITGKEIRLNYVGGNACWFPNVFRQRDY